MVAGKRGKIARALRDKYTTSPDTWCTHGEIFAQAANNLFTAGNPLLYFPAALLGHQALEMLLKAALLRRGCKISEAWGHNLVGLAERLTADGSISLHGRVFEVAKAFDAYFKELRYPQELQDVQELGDEAEHLEDATRYLLPYARPPRARFD